MQANFTFQSGDVEVTVDGRRLDLHNDYRLLSYRYEIVARLLTMVWVLGSDNRAVTLQFGDVGSLEVGDRDPVIPTKDDDCLEYIGYVPPGANPKDGFLDQSSVSPADDLVLAFESGWFIRLKAGWARLSP